MRKVFLVLSVLVAATFLLVSCGDQGAGNAANKPANVANNTAPANTAASSASADADVKKLMNDLAVVLAKNDADAAAKFYTEDYHLVTPDGVVQTKSERLADMRSGSTKFDSFSYNDVNVRTYGDTAVAVATVKATGVVAGRPRTSDMRATLVLRKMADGWKVVSGQATPVIAAAAPTKTDANKPAANTAGNATTPAPANKY